MLFSIVAAAVIIVKLAGLQDYIGRSTYVVEFDLTESVAGLKTGAEVRLGGRKIGAIRAVETGERIGGGGMVNLVKIGVDSKIKIHKDARAELKKSLLGDSGTINFPSLGDPASGDVDDGDRIDGVIPPFDLFAQAGYGDRQKKQLEAIFDNVAEGSKSFRTVIEDFKGEPYAQLKEVIARAQAYLKDNQEDVREGVKSVRAATKDFEEFAARINKEYADKISKMLDRGNDAVDRATIALEKADHIIDENRPAIRSSMANFRLASDQLKSTLLEIRRSPWRLLYRPDTRELEFELLYDAARSYADTVTNLRTASESLESLMASGGLTSDQDRQTLDDLVKNLDASRGKYQEAEKAFLELIKQKNSEK